MVLNITLQDERGEVLSEVVDPEGLLIALIAKTQSITSCCLRFIDPWGITVFNGLQMDQFLIELESLRTSTDSVDELHLVESIIELATRCKEEPHQYIKILGD